MKNIVGISTSPPEEIHVHGLYVIVTETDDEWMHRSILDQPDQCEKNSQILKKNGLLV